MSQPQLEECNVLSTEMVDERRRGCGSPAQAQPNTVAKKLKKQYKSKKSLQKIRIACIERTKDMLQEKFLLYTR